MTDAGKDAEKGNPPTLLVGMQACATTLENSMEFLKKLKIELPYDPATALLGSDLNGHVHPNVIAAMSTIAKLWKEPRCPSTDEWIKKRWYI